MKKDKININTANFGNTVLVEGLFQPHIETKYAKDTGLQCPKCGEYRMTRHLLHGKRFCWAGCGWIDEPPCR